MSAEHDAFADWIKTPYGMRFPSYSEAQACFLAGWQAKTEAETKLTRRLAAVKVNPEFYGLVTIQNLGEAEMQNGNDDG